MRGDLIIKTDTIIGLGDFTRAIVDGDKIAGSNGDGVLVRSTAKTRRIALNKDAVKAVGGAGPVRFVMSLNRVKDGGTVYRMIPAGDRPAHAEIRTRN